MEIKEQRIVALYHHSLTAASIHEVACLPGWQFNVTMCGSSEGSGAEVVVAVVVSKWRSSGVEPHCIIGKSELDIHQSSLRKLRDTETCQNVQ